MRTLFDDLDDDDDQDDESDDDEQASRRLRRNEHPDTSDAAARAIVPRLADLQRWVIRCVQRSPGLTRRELGAFYCPSDSNQIGRRLRECARLGFLRVGPARICRISGRPAQTWFPVVSVSCVVEE